MKINDSVMESSCICGQVKIPHRTMIYLERELAPMEELYKDREKVVESCERLIIKTGSFCIKVVVLIEMNSSIYYNCNIKFKCTLKSIFQKEGRKLRAKFLRRNRK